MKSNVGRPRLSKAILNFLKDAALHSRTFIQFLNGVREQGVYKLICSTTGACANYWLVFPAILMEKILNALHTRINNVVFKKSNLMFGK